MSRSPDNTSSEPVNEDLSRLTATSTAQPPINWLFFGADGLRAGWSVLLFVVLVTAMTFAVRETILFLHHGKRIAEQHEMTAAITLYSEAGEFAVFAFAAWIMSLVERRSFGVYGLGGTRRIGDLLQGLAWGIAAISLLVGVLYAAHLLAFDGVALHGSAAWSYGLKWTAAFLLVGFVEEFMTRGYIQYTVARGISGVVRAANPESGHTHAIGFWIAAFVFSALVFMGLHMMNPGETVIGILAVGVAGLTFAYSLWRTGALWWAIGFHAAWDWGQSYLYGVADSGGMVQGHLLASHPIGAAWLSGGSDGPEGSVLVIPTLLLVCLIIRLTLPRRAYPLTASQQPPSVYTQP